MEKPKIEWVVVPLNDSTNDSIFEFLGQEAEESQTAFSYDGKQRRGYVSPIGYELVTRLRRFASHNEDVKFEVYKKEDNKQEDGPKFTPFSFEELKKKKAQKLLRDKVRRGSDS